MTDHIHELAEEAARSWVEDEHLEYEEALVKKLCLATLRKQREELEAEHDVVVLSLNNWIKIWKGRAEQAESSRDAAVRETEQVRALLMKIARGPIMPLPDPEAHSWRAYGQRAAGALADSMMWANKALNILAPQERPCTCHPDDNPPVPCPKKYALIECRRAAALAPSAPIPPEERRGIPDVVEMPFAWIEHHKGGDNLVWERSNLPCSPLYRRAAPVESADVDISASAPESTHAATLFYAPPVESGKEKP